MGRKRRRERKGEESMRRRRRGRGRVRRGRERKGGRGGQGGRARREGGRAGDQYTWRTAASAAACVNNTFLASRPAPRGLPSAARSLRRSASAGLSGGSGGGEHGTTARLSFQGRRRAAESHVAAAETSREARTLANSGRVRGRSPGSVTAGRTVWWKLRGRCARGDLWGHSVLEAEEKEDLALVVWLSS